MKNRAYLSLMEQLVMILVFAVSASLCLQGFVAAQQISKEIADKDRAVYLIQNTAEELKAGGGKVDEAVFDRILPGVWAAGYDSNWNLQEEDQEETYRLQITKTKPTQPGLGMAELQMVSVKTGKCLFGVTVAWQEAMA